MAEDRPDADVDADGAALAFEALRAEVAGLRGSVEALRRDRPPDYSPTLAGLSQTLQVASVRLASIERHTGATVAAEVARREIMRVYDGALHPARLDLERATREVLDAGTVLAAASGGLRASRHRRHRLAWAGAGGLAAGMLAVPLVVAPLATRVPGVSERMALAVVGGDGWAAGAALMRRADPARWRSLVEAEALGRDNAAALQGCRNAAARTGQAQRCGVTVDPAILPP